MTARLNIFAGFPPLLKQFQDYSNAVQDSGIDKRLIKLIEIRASQINGCANCLNMHSFEAHKLGESDQRLHLVATWHDAPVFSDRERAALAWTEHLTLIAEKRAPDEVYAALESQFTKDEQLKLTMLINVINSWNRLCVGFNLFVPSLGWEREPELKVAV
jgi:AhpD family alkylhydroperoxidase